MKITKEIRSAIAKESGRKGGLTTRRRYGIKFFKTINKKSQEVRKKMIKND